MARAGLVKANQRARADAIADAVRPACNILPDIGDHDAFASVFDRFAGARVMLMGEASHGTSEFYRARAAITRRLIGRHGFNIVAVEADWPDARRIDRYVRHRGPEQYDEKAFARFPTWMWRNQEVADFVDWLHAHNSMLQEPDRIEFRGLDVYSLRGSAAAVIAYLDKVDPPAAQIARERYGCLTPWQSDPALYGHTAISGLESCEDAVVEQLTEMLSNALDYAARDGEDYFDASQNARIVRAAEHYYRTMYRGANDSWNLRDRHMFDTLQALMARRGPSAKAIVWAHNSHIGNAAATEMGWQGQFNVGELARTAYGDQAVLIGFGTDRGTVAAADDWGSPMRVKDVLPSRADSYEQVFLRTGIQRGMIDLLDRRNRDARDALSQVRLERAIGVIYRPQTELRSHYFEAVLPEQFDAYVWFEQTGAVTPLPSEPPHGVPETYPFGV